MELQTVAGGKEDQQEQEDWAAGMMTRGSVAKCGEWNRPSVSVRKWKSLTEQIPVELEQLGSAV